MVDRLDVVEGLSFLPYIGRAAEKYLEKKAEERTHEKLEENVEEEYGEILNFYKGFAGRGQEIDYGEESPEIYPRENDQGEAEEVGLDCIEVYMDEEEGLRPDSRHELFRKTTLRAIEELAAAPPEYEDTVINIFAERYARSYLDDQDLLVEWCEKHEEMEENDSKMRNLRGKINDKKKTEHELARVVEDLEGADVSVDSTEDREKMKSILDETFRGNHNPGYESLREMPLDKKKALMEIGRNE